jgi:hypothetical protein
LRTLANYNRLIFDKFIVQFFPQSLAWQLTEKIRILFYAGCSEGAGDFECWTWEIVHLGEESSPYTIIIIVEE